MEQINKQISSEDYGNCKCKSIIFSSVFSILHNVRGNNLAGCIFQLIVFNNQNHLMTLVLTNPTPKMTNFYTTTTTTLHLHPPSPLCTHPHYISIPTQLHITPISPNTLYTHHHSTTSPHPLRSTLTALHPLSRNLNTH